MPPEPRHPLDKNVPPNWRTPAGLVNRKPGMALSDRIWHWLVSLPGALLIAGGVAWVAYAPFGKRLGISGIAVGFVIFILGFPSEAQRNGYRE